jgi:anti-sigma B factor antagonist
VGSLPDEFRIEASFDGPVARLAVFGEIDAATAPSLEERLAGVGEGHREVIIDFRGVEFIDSAGLTVLVAAHTRLRTIGAELVIEAPPAKARRIFDISGLDRVLTIRE